MKKIVLVCMLFSTGLTVNAQPQDSVEVRPEFQSKYIPVFQYWEEHNIFQHLDASLTVGTTGFGVDFASPIGNYLQLRTGFEFMPHFHHRMSFSVEVGDSPTESAATFESLSEKLTAFTGFKVDNKVDAIGLPTFYNFKFLVDVFPFKQNKHWHFTAGFYWGNSQIAKAYNATEDMPTLMAVSIYNHMYEKAINLEPLFPISIGGEPDGWPSDPWVQEQLKEKFLHYGRMGVKLGKYVSDGSPYIMEPDENSMVKAKVTVNSFKPYLGFGYGGRLLKNNDKYNISFDCGAMFWGGTPNIIVHDGTNLSKDVNNIRWSVGDYVRLVKGVKVFPVLNVRVTRSIF